MLTNFLFVSMHDKLHSMPQNTDLQVAQPATRPCRAFVGPPNAAFTLKVTGQCCPQCCWSLRFVVQMLSRE